MTAEQRETQNDGRPVPSYNRDQALAVVSISGGKDSLATALVAIEQLGRERVRLVHADTGHEHEITERYVRETLPRALGLPIEIVRADFAADIARKRGVVETKWRAEGVAPEICDAALAILHPTGNPFLDLCIWKGRFPSRRAQFCTEQLKKLPLNAFLDRLKAKTALHVENWQGVRRDESLARREALEWEISDVGSYAGWIHRPIAAWSTAQTFEIAKRYGIPSNPLYAQGMRRVGCMPCINCSKGELREIAARFPGVIERVRRWERLVGAASKRGGSSFFHMKTEDNLTHAQRAAASSVMEAVAWSRTSRGGVQFDLEAFTPSPACSSIYGLCE